MTHLRLAVHTFITVYNVACAAAAVVVLLTTVQFDRQTYVNLPPLSRQRRDLEWIIYRDTFPFQLIQNIRLRVTMRSCYPLVYR